MASTFYLFYCFLSSLAGAYVGVELWHYKKSKKKVKVAVIFSKKIKKLKTAFYKDVSNGN